MPDPESPGTNISLLTPVPAQFLFQATNRADNELTGVSNNPVDIPVGGSQTYVISLTPTAPFPITEIQFSFACVGEQAAVLSGLNTLELSTSSKAVLDIVALSGTARENGIVDIDGSPPTGLFSVMTVNLVASGSIDVGTEFLGNLPMALSVYKPNANSGICLNSSTASLVTEIEAGATPTFAIFLQTGAKIPLDSVNNRVRVELGDTDNVLRGSTSVAA